MSVIIKGMEMPKSCKGCQLHDRAWCSVTKEFDLSHEEMNEIGVHNCCPLVEIPKGHKIGDLTVLEQKFIDTCVGDCGCCGKAFDYREDCSCLVIKDAPAILEAESEEE